MHGRGEVLSGGMAAENFCTQATPQAEGRSKWVLCTIGKDGGCDMFLVLAILLAVAYVISLVVVHTAPFLIHLLIIFAVISLVMHLISGRKA